MNQSSLFHRLCAYTRQELAPRRLWPSLSAGLVTGLLSVIYAISYATLVFSGELSAYVPLGVGMALFSTALIGAVVALSSSFSGSIAGPQGRTIAVLALATASIGGTMAASTTADQTFLTVVAAIVLMTLFTGLFFFVLGAFNLGRLVRFIPYPVMGGFLAGSGWLLVTGSLKLMIDMPFKLSQMFTFLRPNVWVLWGPGLLFAVVLLIVSRRFKHFWVVPSFILISILIFYLALALTGTPLSEAAAQGWLLKPFAESQLWRPLPLSELGMINWKAILAQFGNLSTVLAVSTISILLTVSGIELVVQRDVDLNQELKAAGVANLLSAMGGGMPGYHSLSLSTLGHRMGIDSRLVGLMSSALCVGVLLGGAPAISFLPKPVLGGLILFTGLSFLVEWVYDAWFKLPRTDYLVVLLILAVVSTVGFLEGIIVGIIAGVVLFVVKYSRIDVVKHALSGVSYQSNVDRAAYHRRVLKKNGEQLTILKLQGFIFFGTAAHLFDRVRGRIDDPTLPPPRFVILDFHLVTGLDSSALNSFIKMQQLIRSRNMTLVFTDLSSDLRRRFEKEGLDEEGDAHLRIFPDLDHGVEWCEDQLLSVGAVTMIIRRTMLKDQLKEAFPRSVPVESLFKYLQERKIPAGQHLIDQGGQPDSLYFLELGQVTVQFEQSDGKAIRLRTMREGTVVGEVGMYLGTPRSASVVADMPCLVYRLSAQALQTMQENDPQVAAAFHRFMARMLAERLADTDMMLQRLLE